MSHEIALLLIDTARIILLLAMGLAIFRMAFGPRAQDRVLGFDALYVNALLLFLVISLRTGSPHYVEAALIIGVVGFFGSSALAKFLLRGEVVE